MIWNSPENYKKMRKLTIPRNEIVLFSQFNLILLSSHLFLLPLSFVGSAVAFETDNLAVCLGMRKGEPNLDVQGVEFCLNIIIYSCYLI